MNNTGGSGHNHGDSSGPEPDRKKSIGEKVREGSLYSAPTIIIVFPLVGFGLGYMANQLWGWPIWIALITMILGLVQGIREVVKLSKKVYGNDGP